MRRTIREDCVDDYGEPYFIVKVVDTETGRVIRRMDGSERAADSRRCTDPYASVEKATGGALRYSSRGIV